MAVRGMPEDVVFCSHRTRRAILSATELGMPSFNATRQESTVRLFGPNGRPLPTSSPSPGDVDTLPIPDVEAVLRAALERRTEPSSVVGAGSTPGTPDTSSR